MIKIDDQKREITLLGEDLPSEKWKVLFDNKVNKETIYNSIIRACEVAKKIDGGENLIKEIKSS